LLPSYSEPLLQEIPHPVFSEAGVLVRMLREDGNHPLVSGNKWWKLRPYLELAATSGKSLVTFGGAWSNHLYATAAGCRAAGIPCVGIIRGERPAIVSATLEFAISSGMYPKFVSRETYREKSSPEFIGQIKSEFGDCIIVPEGGSGPEAVEHCNVWGQKISAGISFDVLCIPVGTGGTFAGLLRGVPEGRRMLGFPALKDSEFLSPAIRELALVERKNWELIRDFHFGGYAKAPAELLNFIRSINQQYDLPLDAVYTGKMFWGLLELSRAGYFPRGTEILAIHTGGLQGNVGFGL